MVSNSYLAVFAKSPFKALEKHIGICLQSCEGLRDFFQAVYENDWQRAEQCRDAISQKEKEADVIKREIRLSLPREIFMPIERTDVLELLHQQDKLANKAKDIAGRVLGRELVIPENLQHQFFEYLNRCVDAASQAQKVINELDELLETGFKGKEVDLVERMIATLDSIEGETDKMQIKVRRTLQSLESELNPVDVMFLYRIIEWVGDLADIAERVGARLELMLAR